jgi:hypothetical protein
MGWVLVSDMIASMVVKNYKKNENTMKKVIQFFIENLTIVNKNECMNEKAKKQERHMRVR